MAVAKIAAAAVTSPSAATLRSMYESAARTLLRNEPLRAESTAALQSGRVLTKGETEALHSVGLNTEPWLHDSSAASDDPLVRSVVDYMALIETSLDTSEAARTLGVDVSRIRQRLRERSLFGVEYEGEWRLPRFQFERKHVLPGLGEVLAAIDPAANPLEVAEWFLSPNVDLERVDQELPVSPRHWLLRGGAPGRIAALARDL
jgi:hypothetical protein